MFLVIIMVPWPSSPNGKFLAYNYTRYGRVPSEGITLTVIPASGGAIKEF